MEKYELTIILDGSATPAKKKSESEKISKLVETYKGLITDEADWGKIDFAYPIKHTDSGVYLYYQLELEASSAKTLNTKLSTEGNIVRYLLTRREN